MTPEHSDAVDAGTPEREVRDSGGDPASAATTRTAADSSSPPEPSPVASLPDDSDPPPSAEEALETAAPDAPEAPAVDVSEEPALSAEEVQEEVHQELERDLEVLAARAERADEYLELAQRTQADFENYRKRAARETAAAQARGVAKLAKELLPAVDNLDRALAAATEANGTENLVSGIRLVHADVVAALARAGIESFSPEGEPFDPQHHEAIAQQPVEGAEPGTVVEVYQAGYRLGDSVLRPARVVVAG